MKGTIKFVSEKGFGFITDDDGVDRFFHISAMVGASTTPGRGDEVNFTPAPGKGGKPAAASVSITKKAEAATQTRPYYGKKTTYNSVEVVKSGHRGLLGGGLGAIGLLVGGPIGAIVGAAIGGSLGSDDKTVTRKVEITTPCLRCGGNGQVTNRVDGYIGFQCPRCKSFWKKIDDFPR